MRFITSLKKHPWRYAAIVAGFVLFVYPSALLIRAAFWLQGSAAMPDLHKTCFRMPFDWMFTGNFANFDGRFLAIGFLGAVLGSAIFFGPLFCGWLCPVGSSTELLSRPVPRKLKIDLSRKINPAALRYGFLGSFAAVSALAVFAPGLGLSVSPGCLRGPGSRSVGMSRKLSAPSGPRRQARASVSGSVSV